MSDDFNEQLENLIPLIDELSILTNEIGVSFNGKYGRDIKLKGFVYLDLMHRINANLEALILLFKKIKESPELKSSIALLIRACLSDVLTGYHLYTFLKDEVTFENEVNVLGYDYMTYIFSMAENEPLFSARELPVEERHKLLINQKNYLAAKYAKIIKSVDQETGIVTKYPPAEIRSTSNKDYFLEGENIKDKITDQRKYERLLKFNSLKDVAYVYLLMRYYAQFQHYSFHNRKVMQISAFNNLPIVVQSFFYITEAVHFFGGILETDETKLNKIESILEKYDELIGLSKNQ